MEKHNHNQELMRKKIVIANWKMHLNTHQASLLLHKLAETIPVQREVDIVLVPNFLVLQSLSLQVNYRQFKLGAQNCYWRDEGAYTGEVSATMLHGLTQYVLIGHSERRHIFNEHDKDVRHKVAAVIRNKMKPVLCIGETAAERAEGETNHVIHDQLVSGLLNVTSEEIGDITIAYEPVWAIGTGDNALPSDVENVAKLIRKQVSSLYGKTAAANVRVLYGGSVNAENAAGYVKNDNVDGFLVGGASLNAHEFAGIVESTRAKNAK
jgi:triosephosphate isomerase